MDVVTYEIRVTGRFSPDLVQEFGHLATVTRQSRTVLRGPLVDQAAIQGILRRLAALGLEIVEFRAVPCVGMQPTECASPTQSDPCSCYEVTVGGRMGPVLRAAFSDHSVHEFWPCTVLVVHDGVSRSLSEIVGLVEGAGLTVQDVRRHDEQIVAPSERTDQQFHPL